MPRECGAAGPVHEHMVLDGALWSVLTILRRPFHEAVRIGMDSDSTEADAFRRWATTTFTGTSCFMHRFHNGCKRGLVSHFEDPGIMRSMWICLESLRNSMWGLVENVGGWISSCMAEDTSSEPVNVEGLWQLLGLEGHWFFLLVQMRLRLKGGQLFVASVFFHHPNVTEIVTTVLLKVWAFRRWSDGRILTCGGSCSTLAVSAVFGLVRYVKFSVDSKLVSPYYVNGFVKRFSGDALKLVSISALSSFPCDAVLALSLKDDRILMQLRSVDLALEQNLSNVENISIDILAIIG